ncbi:MAG: hypothetical protein M3340_00690 [Actinomycetota bacterium]|nr:hypothetical protein [Actinomycetota bacterium]
MSRLNELFPAGPPIDEEAGWFSLQTVSVYYARDVLGSANYYVVLTIVQTAGIFAWVPRRDRRAEHELTPIARVSGDGQITYPV